MTRKKKSLIGFLIILLVLLLWIFNPKKLKQISNAADHPLVRPSVSQSPQTAASSSPQPIEERRNQVVRNILSMFATPIQFYGKVIDQNGDPVPDAEIGFSAADKFDAPGSGYVRHSDRNGFFSITGIQGAALIVTARKKGYYFIPDLSSQSFAYGVGPDSSHKEPPTKDNPAIFTLQKGGTIEPLIQVSSRQIDIPRAGQPLSVDLATGGIGQGNLQIESKLGDVSQHRFDWSYRLNIPNGGLTERKGQFDFEAPADGYRSSIEINMASSSEGWSSDVNKSYFAKLPDGRYARFSVNFYPGNRNFVVLESYVNPKAGSRNLEFDPTKVVKSP